MTITDCKDCRLHTTRHKIVKGKGNIHSQVIFIGEAPGADENVAGEPFVGKAGKVLDSLFPVAGLKREDVYITNVVKCRPPNNRVPEKDEVTACKKYLELEIAEINPKIIVCLGASAAKAVTGLNKDMGSFTKQAWDYHGNRVLVMYHPASTFYRSSMRTKLMYQMEELGEILGTKEKISAEKIDQGADANLEAYTPKCIYNNDEAIAFLNRLIEDSGDYIAFDTETTGIHYKCNHIIGMSFAFRSKKTNTLQTAYIPIRHTAIDTVNIDLRVIYHHLQAVLATKKVLFHNAKFDLHMLDNESLKVNDIEDTMLMSYCYNENEMSHGLKNLSVCYLSLTADKSEKELASIRRELGIENDCTAEDTLNWSSIPVNKMFGYACTDTVLTFLLYEFYKEKTNKPIYEKEVKLVTVLKNIEEYGIKIDLDYLTRLSGDMTLRLYALREKLWEQAGEKFNVGSTQQLQSILNNKFSYETVAVSKKTGQMVTDNTALIEYYDCEFTRDIRKYRAMDKLLHTYIQPIILRSDNEVLRTDIMNHRANNGRLASANPNLQNLPKHSNNVFKGSEEKIENLLRRGLVILSPEYKLAFADYSQIELRFIAMYANIAKMIDVYKSNGDIHKLTSQLMYKIEKVSKDQRFFVKTVNFLLGYGGGIRPIVKLLIKDEVPIPEGFEDVYDFGGWVSKTWHEVYPESRKFVSLAERKAFENKQVKNLYGRIRHLTKENAWTAAQFVCSSCAADVVKDAMIKINDFLIENNMKSQMILQIHDELIFNMHRDEEHVLLPAIKQLMERHDLVVPVLVNIETSETNWIERKEIIL
jgi:DNA polymerase I